MSRDLHVLRDRREKRIGWCRDAESESRCRGLCVLFCSFASLRGPPFPHEILYSLVYPSKPSADLLRDRSPPFELWSKDRHLLLNDAPSSPSLAPWVALPPTRSPNIIPCGRRPAPMRATNPAKNIVCLRAVAAMPSELVVASASAWNRVWSSRSRFFHTRHQRSTGW